MTGYKPFAFNYLERRCTKKFQTLKNYLGWGGVALMHKNFCKGTIYEEDILNNGKYFIGRTHWDKSHVLFHNPQAKYFQGEELFRDEFYNLPIHGTSPNVAILSLCQLINSNQRIAHAIETIYL